MDGRGGCMMRYYCGGSELGGFRMMVGQCKERGGGQ